MGVTSKCYRCSRMIPPVEIKPIDKDNKEYHRKSKSEHSCSRCKDGKRSDCPLYNKVPDTIR